jgi:hypothetical protein
MSASSEVSSVFSVYFRWLRNVVAGAQYLLHVKTAIINGRLDHWTDIPGIIQYWRISPPDPQVFAGL